ncbi:MAG: GNAT family N-acetyltransferase [bacterium]
MQLEVTIETFESFAELWNRGARTLRWSCPFVLPPWLETWWRSFGGGRTPLLLAVKEQGRVLGIAPLMIEGGEARFMGSENICDYMDCTVAAGRGRECFQALLPFLRQEGVRTLDLGPVRGDSVVVADLVPAARDLGCEILCRPEEVTVERDLPATWDDFLALLSGKERHEIRRKMRRLETAGAVRFRVIDDEAGVRPGMETFLTLFMRNRPEKRDFMTGQMSSFFRALAESLARLAGGVLRLSILEIDGVPAAAVMCLDYGSTVYLYNNGYDGRFASLSVGFLSKVLTIRDGIDRGREKYEFLKGGEPYKLRLGGRPVPLHRCRVGLR